MDGFMTHSSDRSFWLGRLRQCYGAEARAAGSPASLCAWVEVDRPSPEALVRVLRRANSWQREEMASYLALNAPSFSPDLIRAIVEADPEATVLLAESPRLVAPALVRALLDACTRLASAYVPEAPFSVYPDWACHRAARGVLARGLVTFWHKGVQQVRRTYRRTPEVEWARILVHADPHTPPRLLERAWRRVQSNTLSRVRDSRGEVLAEVIRRNTRPEMLRERWSELLSTYPSRASRIVDLPHLRALLGPEDVRVLLEHETQEVRLAGIRLAASAVAKPRATPAEKRSR